MIDYDVLDPGVRRLVRWLNEQGFWTTDSGDGVSKCDTMDCAIDVPNVAILVPDEVPLVTEARRLRDALRSIGIECVPNGALGVGEIHASYDPVTDIAILLLLGVSDKHLPAEAV